MTFKRVYELQGLFTLQDVGWTHVYLSHHHEHGHIESQSETQVLFGHPHDAGVTANLRQRERRHANKGIPTVAVNMTGCVIT